MMTCNVVAVTRSLQHGENYFAYVGHCTSVGEIVCCCLPTERAVTAVLHYKLSNVFFFITPDGLCSAAAM